MFVYFKREGNNPMRLDAESEMVAKLVEEGWEAASFAEWWESLGEDGQKHQMDLVEQGSEEALDETEKNFLAEIEKKIEESAEEEPKAE